tara:strand:- start:3362 stop:3583 length:222 start_codon:yes stop_codon:yes gene_type:complete
MNQDETDDIKRQLMAENSEYRRIFTEHQELETRLSELSSRNHLLADEKIEAGLIKKRKLVLKDELEAIARQLD